MYQSTSVDQSGGGGGGGGVYQSTSGAGAPNLDDLEQEIYENFRDPSR